MKTFSFYSRFSSSAVLILTISFLSAQLSFAQIDVTPVEPTQDVCISSATTISVSSDIASWLSTSTDNLYHFKLEDRLNNTIIDEHNVVGTSTVMNGLVVGVTYRVIIAPACNSGIIDVAHEAHIDFVKTTDGIIHGDVQILLAPPPNTASVTLYCTFDRVRSALESNMPFPPGDVCEPFNSTLQTANTMAEPYKQLILSPQNSTYSTHVLGTAWLNISTAVGSRFDNYIVSSAVNRTSALPIKLLNFKAVTDTHTTNLYWATASESNSKQFEIERSTNGIDFVKIGQLEAAGTSNTLHNYHFEDKKPLLGRNYYRLKSIDLDGSNEYSSVESSIFRDKNDWCQVYPTVVNTNVNIKIAEDNEEEIIIRLTDALGKDLLQQHAAAGTQNISISLDYLPTGVYYLYLQKNSIQYTQKLVKK